MVYQTSQFDFLFLLNAPIPILLSSGETLSFKTPDINSYYEKIEYRSIESLFLTSLSDVKQNAREFGFVANSYLDLILGTKMKDPDNSIFKTFEKIAGIEITKQNVTCNGVPLIEEDILEIRYSYLLSTGKMDINGEFTGKNKEEEDEMSRKLRESEERIKALRNKGQTDKDDMVSFKEMILLIMYELNKSPKELKELNFYGIIELYKLASAGSYDKIQKVAAGNGLLGEDNAYQNILSK